MAQVTLKLSGDKQLMAALNVLPERIDQRVTANAVRAGARLIVKATKANVESGGHVVTGHLLEGLSVRSKWYKASGVFAAYVGSRQRLAPHLHLLEKGHKGPHPAPAYPVLAPAFDATAGAARTKIEANFRRGVAREAAKLPKGPAR